MKKNKIILIIITIIILIICIIGMIIVNNKKKNELNNKDMENVQEDYLKMKEESVMYEENANISELKEEYKMTGSDELYEISTEDDGRKVLNIKADINYKVAFCGMLNDKIPKFEEIDFIYENNMPKETGIWINPKDRDKIINFLNNNEELDSEYSINEKGYLVIIKSDTMTDVDKEIENAINGSNLYVIGISSTSYMIDTVTGEIIDNPYNELDSYQTYEYLKDDNKVIIFLSESEKVEKQEIFDNVLNLIISLNKD